MRKKRLISLCMATMMVTGLLVGCGEKAETTLSPTPSVTVEQPSEDVTEEGDNSTSNGGEKPSDENKPSDEKASDENESSDAKEEFVIAKEYERAVAYGFVPEDWEDDLDKSVTHQEYCELLATLIQKVNPEKLSEWNEIDQKAMESDEIIKRDSAAMGLLYAAQVLDICYMNTCEYPKVVAVQHSKGYDSSFTLWPELPNEYPILQSEPGTPITEYYMTGWSVPAEPVYWFTMHRTSRITEKPLLDYTETYDMCWYDELTRREAIHSVVRLVESESNLLCNNNYISIYDFTTYDKNIITDELLSSPTNLPEPTHTKLPSSWKGMGLSKQKDTVGHYYADFQEGDLAFYAENGFNFARVFFFFESLGYPDFPEDLTLINEQELLELDQLIAWGIEYDVHIQLSLARAFGNSQSLVLDDATWELFRAYWEMLIRRYAGIPSRYLSFDLANEMIPSPENVPSGVEHMREVVESLRVADPDRVLLISFNDNPWKDWVDGVASLGVCVAYHPYRPAYIMSGDEYYYAPGDTPWPYPYFPQVLQSSETLTVSGNIGGKVLRLDFWVYDPFKIVFNNGETVTVTVEGDYIHPDSCGSRFYEPYAIEIPEGVTSLTLQPLQNSVAFQEIGMEYGDESRWLVPHDVQAQTSSGGADLIWNDETGWGSEKNYTVETIYEKDIKPIQKVAEKYNVGFMINEMGSFAAEIGWDVSIKQQVDSDIIAMLEEHDLPWCMCEMDYMSDLFTEIFNDWENTTVKTFVHISEEGYKHTIQYSMELLDMYRQFTME